MGLATARALVRPVTGPPMRVLLIDRDATRLARAAAELATAGDDLVQPLAGDLGEERVLAAVSECDATAAALSWIESRPLFELARRHPLQLATIGRPPVEHAAELVGQLADGARVVVGLGLEPGLTEIVARRLLDRTGPDAVLRLFCGGVPQVPRPPLRHLAWYSRTLTISLRPTFRIEAGRLEPVLRFSEVELVDVPGVGTLEAYHDGLAPWITDDPTFAQVPSMTQKTLRWPGYAAQITMLAELGLTGEEPVPTVDGTVRPRAVLDAVLAPHITPRPGDADVTLLVAQAACQRTGRTASTVLRADAPADGGTSGMGVLTAGALAAGVRRLVDAPDLPTGMLYAHQAIAGQLADDLLAQLGASGVSVQDHDQAWVTPAGSITDATSRTSAAGASRAVK